MYRCVGYCTAMAPRFPPKASDLSRKATALAEQISDAPAQIEALVGVTADALASGVELAKSQAYREYLNQCSQAAPLLQLRGKRSVCYWWRCML